MNVSLWFQCLFYLWTQFLFLTKSVTWFHFNISYCLGFPLTDSFQWYTRYIHARTYVRSHPSQINHRFYVSLQTASGRFYDEIHEFGHLLDLSSSIPIYHQSIVNFMPVLKLQGASSHFVFIYNFSVNSFILSFTNRSLFLCPSTGSKW